MRHTIFVWIPLRREESKALMGGIFQSTGFRLLLGIAVVYLLFVGLTALLQDSLIYYPQRAPMDMLQRDARAMELELWGEDVDDYHGWRLRQASEEPPEQRMIVFHGNAGYALNRGYFLNGFTNVEGGGLWEVFLFEYPGYGAREGRPGQERILAAAEDALETLLDEDDRPVYLVGESLGAGVAALLAAKYPEQVEGLFLITPFTNLAAVGSHHYPWLPVRWLLRDDYDAEAALQDYAGPVAVMLAGQDRVIPNKFGRELYHSYDGPAQLWVQDAAGHNSLDYRPYATWWSEVSGFLLSTP